MFKLTVLTENTASGRYIAEHGLSYLIEYDGIKLLFDTGATDVFLQNARKMNIDMSDINAVVLSHGHFDHGDGLQFISGQKLIAHPDIFMKRYRKSDKSYIGLALSEKQAREKFELITTKSPYEISDKILFLGEIPRTNNFEARKTNFVDENNQPEFVPDDSGLAIVTEKGLVVVSGCAHSGICNIVDYACKVTGMDNVYMVIGGFHLKSDGEETIKTIETLKKYKIDKVRPSHCTDFPALTKFYEAFHISRVCSGDIFEF